MSLKLIITGLFCMICSNAVHAGYDAADLQKLFTDKKQRARIDATRSGDHNESDKPKKTSKIKVSGYVKRSNGKSVVWINNENTLESSNIDGANVHQSSIGKNKKVTVTVNGKTKQLKPGETWDKDSERSGMAK